MRERETEKRRRERLCERVREEEEGRKEAGVLERNFPMEIWASSQWRGCKCVGLREPNPPLHGGQSQAQ